MSQLGSAAPRPARAAQVVLLPSPAGLPEALTYLVPEPLSAVVAVGIPVVVPLSGRAQLGYVLSVGDPPAGLELERLRSILSVPRAQSAFDTRMLELLRWIADEYRCSLGEALPLAVPERHAAEMQTVVHLAGWDGALPPRLGLLSRQTLEALYISLEEAGGSMPRPALEAAVRFPNLGPILRRARKEGWVREERVLLPPRVHGRTARAVRLIGADVGGRLGPRQREVLDHLQARDEEIVLQQELCRELDVDTGVLTSLVRRGFLEREDVAVRRAPRGFDAVRDTAPALTPFQGSARDAINAAMSRGEGDTLLLFGVTGSGKTEVYLHAIEHARDSGRTACLLVPEISLTAQVAAAVRRRLGERVAILHSALSDGERFDEWERLRRGQADVVVGPRSALFAPLSNPALIVLDEEHDGSYKQDAPAPRYHTRDAARARARISGGCVLLGSATPSVESYHAALSGSFTLLELPERVRQRPLPSVEIVDQRAESRTRPGAVFGRRLEDAIRQRLASGEQVILFLNRRGISAFLLCRDCGHVPRCPSCDVSLTLHRREGGALLCHYCGHSRSAPTTCERCAGARVRQFGLGTQRVEEAVRDLFPRARTARLDRDTTTVKDAHVRIVNRMRAGDIDILIGTQMVTKGFDFPGVTLVGVVTADVALNMPDFRAGERAFQVLTQVAGRAGRGERPGEVVIQTFNPDHPSIQAASRHDYRGFFEVEIQGREALRYPPFGSLARLVAVHPDEATARSRLESAASMLGPVARDCDVELRGPAPCPLPRLKDRYRWHLLLKGGDHTNIRAALDDAWPLIRSQVGGVIVDVEPQDLL